MTTKTMNYKDLKEVSKMTRTQIVPYYLAIIKDVSCPDFEVGRINDLILSKFKPSGLLWIKEQAWKRVSLEKSK